MTLKGIIKSSVTINTITPHYEYISSLRAMAALSIVAFHVMAIPKLDLSPLVARYVSHMSLGVPLFYLLSAYTLCLSVFKRTDESIFSFYTRRFFRIAPLFYFMILLYVVRAAFNVSMADILTNVLFVFNFMPQSGKFEGIVPASWSIGVEMPFYLIFPFLLRASKRMSRTVWIFVLVLIISYLFRLGLHWISINGMAQQMGLSSDMIRKYGYMSLITNLPYFMLGIFTFLIHDSIGQDRTKKSIGTVLLVVSLLAFIGLPHMSDKYLLNPFPARYVWGLFFVLLVSALFLSKNNLIVNRITAFWGEISYSMYLIHPLVIFKMTPIYSRIYSVLHWRILSFVCCFAVTVFVLTLVSIAAYKLIEFPGMRLGRNCDKRLRAVLPEIYRTFSFFPSPKLHEAPPDKKIANY